MMRHQRHSTRGDIGAIIAWLLSALLLLSGCVQEDLHHCPSPQQLDEEDFYISMSVLPQSASQRGDMSIADINQQLSDMEDKVATVRVLIFDHNSGRCIVNQLLDTYMQPHEVTTPWSAPVRVPMNIESFDFYFVANEASTTYNLTTALLGVTERQQLYTLPELTQIPWQPEFLPKRGVAGDDLIPMTAIYQNVSLKKATIDGMLGAGTEQDPYRFLSEGGRLRQVRLTRVLARMDIKIPNVIINSTLGDPDSDEILALSYIDDFQMSLVNVPRYFSLFASRYYDTLLWTDVLYTPIASHYYTNPKDGQDCYYIEDNIAQIRRNMASTKDGINSSGAIGELNFTDYYTVIYLPEYIRRKDADTGITPDKTDAMKIRLFFSVTEEDPLGRTVGYHAYNYPLEDNTSERTTPELGQLAGADLNVSDYSVIRNTQYKITIREIDPTTP